MTISFGTLFATLGKLGKTHHDAQAFASGALSTDMLAALSAVGTNYPAVAALSQALVPGQQSVMQVAPSLRQAAAAVLNATVNADVPQSNANDTTLSLLELIRQMLVATESVADCALGATAAAASGNTGTGVVLLTTLRGDGLKHQNLFAEVGDLTCTGDSQSGGSTAGQEPFQFRGDPAESDPLAWDWPLGSGATATLAATDATQSNSAGNLLVNSDFETFTVANTPDNWVIATGAAGSQIFSEASVVYRGAKSLRLTGDSSTLTALTQAFNVTTAGTAAALRPQTSYGFNLFCRVDVVPAAGVLAVQLVDGSGTVVNDAQAVANTVTQSVPALTTSWVSFKGVIRTPKVIPASGLKLRLKLTTALSTGTNLYVDSLALAFLTPLYAGGPAVAVYSGAVPFVAGDRFILTMTNNRAGTTYATTWNSVFDRWFAMKQLNLVLPVSGSPTQADSLLT